MIRTLTVVLSLAIIAMVAPSFAGKDKSSCYDTLSSITQDATVIEENEASQGIDEAEKLARVEVPNPEKSEDKSEAPKGFQDQEIES